MAHILFVTTGRVSLGNCCVELGRRLRRAGHRVTFAGPQRTGDIRNVSDFEFVPIDTRWQPRLAAVTKGAARSLKRSNRDFRAAAANVLLDTEYGAQLAGLQPDLVLVEAELPPYIIFSAVHARRTAVLCSFIASRKVPGVPPLHTAIQPGRGIDGSVVGIEWAWLRYRAGKALRHLLNRYRPTKVDSIGALVDFARRVGFPYRRQFALYDWPWPMSFKTIPTLNVNAVELDFTHPPHPTQLHTGPLIDEKRDDRSAAPPSTDLASLDAFLAQRDSRRRLIFCGFGTAFKGDDSDFIVRLTQAFRVRCDWDVVIALGARPLGELPVDLLPHVHVFDWVPQLELLAISDCAVLHGGPGSICECIHFEVPMVLFPFPVNDQLGYAARAGYHNLGIVGDRDRDDPARILAHIDRVLVDNRFREALALFNARLQKYKTDNIAVRAVEKLLD